MHVPVLEHEVVEFLCTERAKVFIDCTLGRGGHAAAILRQTGGAATVLGLDRDAEAVARATARLSEWPGRCFVEQANFADLKRVAATRGMEQVDGILIDLGVSSEQLDTPERGFSFRHDAPLDMRMDRSSGATAADLVNQASEEELRDILRSFGEEPQAGRIARAIARAREEKPVERTAELADLVARALGGRHGKTHPATRTFQALRMAVNDELGALETALEDAIPLLAEGGRVAVISFHSLEDRLVKRCFASHAGRWEALQQGGAEWRGREPRVRIVTKKPVTPGDEERERNPRARSAKLRVAERRMEDAA